jgi:predicted AAA+ superfamily ATPase
MKRFQKQAILADLKKKMVFLAGPRQAGKTWLAKDIATTYQNPVYLNYDDTEHRKIMKEKSWRENTDLLILDELHKMPRWKNYLKGVYDTKLSHLHILVTGSARLDLYRKVGDSLAGRYFLHHLLPLSLSELKQNDETPDMQRLIAHSGFPEPYLAETLVEAKRWRAQYIQSLIRIDVLNFNPIQHIHVIQMMVDLLRQKVGSPISYLSIAEDVQVSVNTVKKYIEILEAIYVIFRITPHSKNIARSLLKGPKIYFYDTGLVEGDEGAIFENFVANALLKAIITKQDYLAEPYQLKYLRTKEGKEIDFIIVKDQKIESAIEAKVSDKEISPTLQWGCKKFGFKGIQLVKELRQEFQKENIEVLKADKYLSSLFL